MKVTTVGLDLAKNVFQVHAVDEAGQPGIRRRPRRNQVLTFFAGLPRCLVGLEACSSAHFWARELIALGHDARIIPPTYVKPYVRRGKNDAADAAAICEAVSRPSMRFVPVKSEEQQSALMLHKARELLLRQQTMLVNALRAHMAELGVTAPKGHFSFKDILAVIGDDADETIPALAKAALRPLALQLRANQEAAAVLEAEIRSWHKESEESRRLLTIPGVGVITASAIAALVPDPSFFRSGPGIRGMARPGAAPAFDRREGKARPDLQAGQPVHTLAAGDRCDERTENTRPAKCTMGSMDQQSSQAPPAAPGHGRAREQDGADRLGRHDQKGDLQAAGRGCAGSIAVEKTSEKHCEGD